MRSVVQVKRTEAICGFLAWHLSPPICKWRSLEFKNFVACRGCVVRVVASNSDDIGFRSKLQLSNYVFNIEEKKTDKNLDLKLFLLFFHCVRHAYTRWFLPQNSTRLTFHSSDPICERSNRWCKQILIEISICIFFRWSPSRFTMPNANNKFATLNLLMVRKLKYQIFCCFFCYDSTHRLLVSLDKQHCYKVIVVRFYNSTNDQKFGWTVLNSKEINKAFFNRLCKQNHKTLPACVWMSS